MIVVRHSPDLMQHLSSFEVDGATVASLLFDGGRLLYPGRKQLESELGYIEPYTLELEARVIEGLSKKAQEAIRLLTEHLFATTVLDPTLEVLWGSHDAWMANGISLDRLVAALVMVERIGEEQATGLADRESGRRGGVDQRLVDAAYLLVQELHSLGFPPTRESLEEIFDGAEPACVGLGLVEL